MNRDAKEITLFELSTSFETNIDDAHMRKVDRYASLCSDLRDREYAVNMYAVEIGSRGYISPRNLKSIKGLLHKLGSRFRLSLIKNNITKIALATSFAIFTSRTEPAWPDPPLFRVSPSNPPDSELR